MTIKNDKTLTWPDLIREERISEYTDNRLPPTPTLIEFSKKKVFKPPNMTEVDPGVDPDDRFCQYTPKNNTECEGVIYHRPKVLVRKTLFQSTFEIVDNTMTEFTVYHREYGIKQQSLLSDSNQE